MNSTSEVGVELARRLRALRTSGFGSPVTQQALAEALSDDQHLGAATISTWEKPREPVLPPVPRLRAYARFFATSRSLEPRPHLLGDDEFTADERRDRDRLERELLGLRDAVLGPAEHDDVALRRSWRFEDSGPLTIICPDLPTGERHPMSEATHPNFTDLLNYADADALVELLGHVRAQNPAMEVFFRRASQMVPDDLSGHVALIGGIGWNPVTRRILQRIELPVRQMDDRRVPDGEVFEAQVDGSWQRFLPQWSPDDDSELVEDVGLLVRMPNPMNSRRSLTLCNGIHSRGVLGAVRSLTDARMRDANEDFLAARFGDQEAFGLLVRVTVVEGRAMTPDLNQTETRLYEWPEVPA